MEAHNFDIRKHLLEYDDVMNKQREVIYAQRRAALGGDLLREQILEMTDGVAQDIVDQFARADMPSEEWDWKVLDDSLFQHFNLRLSLGEEERSNRKPDDLMRAAGFSIAELEAGYAKGPRPMTYMYAGRARPGTHAA